MQLTELVETSRRVTDTSRRSEKIATLAACLRRLSPDEIAIGVAYLSGEPRQSKLGVGPSTILQARPATAATASTLTLAEVDGTLERVAAPPAPARRRSAAGCSGSCCHARRRQSRSSCSACCSASCVRERWRA